LLLLLLLPHNQVKLIVEEGRANLAAVDRAGRTALDEAQHAGAGEVVSYLSSSSSGNSALAGRSGALSAGLAAVVNGAQ
jgi:ankyrin repeat protein